MDKLFQFTSQPIQNSPWKMTLNLALTPLIIAVILFPYALFHEASSGGFLHFQKPIFGAFEWLLCLPDLLGDGLSFPISDSSAATLLSAI